MNRIAYTLTAEDLLRFNLYFSSVSPSHTKYRRRHRVFIPIFYIVLALLMISGKSHDAAALLLVLAAAWFVLSPRWLEWRFRKYYERHIAETSGVALPSTTVIELQPEGILSSSYLGEMKFRYDAVDRIVENDDVTYVFIGKGMALVLPHDRVPKDTVAAFVAEIQERRPNGERSP